MHTVGCWNAWVLDDKHGQRSRSYSANEAKQLGRDMEVEGSCDLSDSKSRTSEL